MNPQQLQDALTRISLGDSLPEITKSVSGSKKKVNGFISNFRNGGSDPIKKGIIQRAQDL